MHVATAELDELERIARIVGDDIAAADAHSLREQSLQDELNVVVFGLFKRGKSTLINAMLGGDVMPTGPLPLTGLTTVSRFGPSPELRVAFADGTESVVDSLEPFVTESQNPHNIRSVQTVDVRWPAPLLQHVALFDTPGIGSTLEWNTQTAHGTLPRTDVAILVVGPDPPIGALEADFAHAISVESNRMFVLLNKVDTAADDMGDILAFTRATLLAHGVTADIFPLSAKNARNQQRLGSEDPAFAAFATTFRSFVDTSGRSVALSSHLRRSLAIVERVRTIAAMRRAAAELPRIERERRLNALNQALLQVDERRRTLELLVDDDVRLLRAQLELKMDQMTARDLPIFEAYAEELAAETSPQRRGELLEAWVGERAAAWRGELTPFVEATLQGAAAKYVRETSGLESTIIMAGYGVLQLPARALEPARIVLAPASLSAVPSSMPTTGLELVLLAFARLLPRSVRRRVLLHSAQFVLRSELDALRGKLRYGIAIDLEKWRRHARESVASHLDGITKTVRSAIIGDRDSSLPAVENHDIADRLEAVAAVLTRALQDKDIE